MIDPDYSPTATWRTLRFRADLLRRLRAFFDSRGFMEVETPVLSADTVVDQHLDPIPVRLFRDPRELHGGRTMWLQTSPEFGMKRLLPSLARADAPRGIYQVTKAFRGGETGPLHNPEFTMVEWYRIGDGYSAGMGLLAELAAELLRVESHPAMNECRRISYRDAWVRALGIDPLSASGQALSAAARSRGIPIPQSFRTDGTAVDDWLDLFMTEVIGPTLGVGGPEILYDYPASQAALAKVRTDGEHAVAERFELFVEGVELANGYHELLDPDVLRQRQASANVARKADGRYELPETNRLLSAMEQGIPSCAGVALGFDRLVMTAIGAKTIADVIAFPVDRA